AFDLAESLLEEAATVTDQLGEDYSKAWSLHYLGELAIARGDYDRAHTLLDEAIAAASSIGAGDIEANSLLALGRALRAQGDGRGARGLFEQVRARITPENSDAVLVELGDLELDAGEHETARHLLEEALRRARTRGQKRSTALTLLGLASLARYEGDSSRAAVLQDEALKLAREMESTTAIVDCLEAIAAVIADEDRHEQAARLLGAAQEARDQNGYVRPPWDSSRCAADAARLRKGLSVKAFDRAFESGARLSLQQAADEALRSEETHGRIPSDWSSLTERERQIAALAAEGLTNPEIAGRLLMSRWTVKFHLSHVYSKLGVAGRFELARKASGNGVKRNGDERQAPHASA
ncbi:MAG: tetratricopeptide repeat protein, partial [Chloroflexi bacterium]|nr:tetratricopeptide repeat protein [Chloroflexota bacterium]